MTAAIQHQLPLVEALATASATTNPRIASKNSRLLGPINLEIERAAAVGGGTIYGANLNGRGSAATVFSPFRTDGVLTTYDTTIPYVAFANYNLLLKASKSTRTGTVTVTVGSATVTGSGTAFTTELAVGDEIVVSGQRKVVKAIASTTVLTVTEVFTEAAAAVAIHLVDGLLVHTTDFTVSDVGGFVRVTLAAAAKGPSGADFELHLVTPVALDTFVTATVYSRRRTVPGKDVLWYVTDATATPSATSVYAVPVGQ
jgi:hypothetical protein